MNKWQNFVFCLLLWAVASLIAAWLKDFTEEEIIKQISSMITVFCFGLGLTFNFKEKQ